MILIHQRNSQTDRQTDGRHAISMPRYALVHRIDSDNIGIADIIDDTDTIEPSLVSRTYFSYDRGKWIYIRRPCNSNIAIQRNGMNGMITRILRFTLTYKYFSKW